MYKNFLKNINTWRKSGAHISTKPIPDNNKLTGCYDEKSTSPIGETAMDYVNRAHDFTKITEEDLSAAFDILRKVCPVSWTKALENRAKAFHQKIMTLRNLKNISRYIDPQANIGNSIKSKNVYDAKNLMVSPELWNMDKIEAGIELKELLHHFTIYAPFRGRPFIRAWLEGLVPCFCHWILIGYSKKGTVQLDTLKNFLGAFGQDGIVVCLADKGVELLNSLKDAARAVEALGRGTVEHYYWKRLTEANCGGMAEWRELATIPSESRDLSQLDTVPAGWLLDSTDVVQVFANIVSPEISTRFEELLNKTFSGMNMNATIQTGPFKTLSRSIAKCHEYREEYLADTESKRWRAFAERFRNVFGRTPANPEDFVWNIMDFARCSVKVPHAREALKVKKFLEESFVVVSVKNGYNANVKVKGSGYRDLKLLVEVEFDDLKLKGVPQVEPKTKIICEIQIICEAWLENKRTTSLSYKILRAVKLKELLVDFSKYLEEKNKSNLIKMPEAREIIKNGWRNLVKNVDFADIDKYKLLLEAAECGWNVGGIEILVDEHKVNIEPKDGVDREIPLIVAAKKGHDKVVQKLIDLKANVNASDRNGETALHWAAFRNSESCIPILVAAGASLKLKNCKGETVIDEVTKYNDNHERLVKLLKGHTLPRSFTTSSKSMLYTDDLKAAALDGSLAKQFDSLNIPQIKISGLLDTDAVITNIENLLQVLWFGGNIDHKLSQGRTLLYHATTRGDLTYVSALLDIRANVNATNTYGWTPLHSAASRNNGTIANLLITARADMDVVTKSNRTALDIAKSNRAHDVEAILLSAGATTKLNERLGSPIDG